MSKAPKLQSEKSKYLPANILLFFNSLHNKSTARGFEPLRAEPNGFLVHHLNHSVTLSCCWPACPIIWSKCHKNENIVLQMGPTRPLYHGGSCLQKDGHAALREFHRSTTETCRDTSMHHPSNLTGITTRRSHLGGDRERTSPCPYPSRGRTREGTPGFEPGTC